MFIGVHKNIRWLGTDHLWLLVILAGLVFFISLVPLPPNDFWWHLKIGEYIYFHKSIPTTNMYAWTLPTEHPFHYGAWLAELLLYLLYRLGGLEFPMFVRTLTAGITFWLVGYEARRKSTSWRIAALVVSIAGLMSINNLPVRTQLWSWIPFMTCYILLGKYADGQIRGRWLLFIPLIMIFWVNVHGSYVLGIVLLGIFFVGESLRTWLKLENAIPWRGISWLVGIGMLSVIATLINPQLLDITQYVKNMMTDQPSQRLVVEWQTPTPDSLANIIFYASILAHITVLAYSRYRPTPTELFLLLAFLWLAWDMQRSVIWYGMVSLPILARGINELPIKTPSLPPRRSWLNVMIAALLFIPVAFVQPWFVDRFPLPQTYWEQVIIDSPAGPLLSVDTPVSASVYLSNNPGGKLFNEMGYGSYLIWALPEQSVFVDPRVELYPYELWQDYMRISNATQYNELLDQYGVDRILLNTTLQKELAKALLSDPLWHLEYEDQRSQIWTKIQE